MASENYNMVTVEQNDETFEVFYDTEKAGFLEYNIKDDILEILHTEVAEEYGGKGLGKELVKSAVEFAKKNNMKIVSFCPYAKKLIEKTPEFKDILTE